MSDGMYEKRSYRQPGSPPQYPWEKVLDCGCVIDDNGHGDRYWCMTCASDGETPKKDMRSIRDLAKEVIEVQDACNLLAVLNGAARAQKRLRGLMGTNEAKTHPIMKLWAEKITHLTYGTGHGNISVLDAWAKVKDIADDKS